MLKETFCTHPIIFPGLVETFRIQAHDFHGEKHWQHPGLELVVPATLPVEIRLRGQDQHVPVGGFALYNAQEPHVDIHHGKSDCFGIIIPTTFIEDLTAGVIADANEVVFENITTDPGPNARRLIETLFAVRQNPEVSAFAVDCLVSDLALELLGGQRHTATPLIRRTLATGHYPGSVSRAKQAIWNHLDDDEFSLDGLARAAKISKFHLVRSFRAVTGVTPMRYRNHLRLELAKSHLTRGGDTTLSIATELGFGDLSSFNKACRRLTGKCPTDFRREKT